MPVAIDAPAEEVTPIALADLGCSMTLVLSATAALVAVHAAVSAEDLDRLDAMRADECTTGRRVRMPMNSVTGCMRLMDAIEALREARGLPRKP